MKKTILLMIAFIGIQASSKAQALVIDNRLPCEVTVNIDVNGGCFGTGTCSIPVGESLVFVVGASTTLTFGTYAAASAAGGGTATPCAVGTFEIVKAGVQGNNCECNGGVNVGEPCLVATGMGPTMYSGSCSRPMTVLMSRPFLPGAALIEIY
jgi:hypothetical protein